eukprot:485627-Hanusia_phi.AAC.1
MQEGEERRTRQGVRKLRAYLDPLLGHSGVVELSRRWPAVVDSRQSPTALALVREQQGRAAGGAVGINLLFGLDSRLHALEALQLRLQVEPLLAFPLDDVPQRCNLVLLELELRADAVQRVFHAHYKRGELKVPPVLFLRPLLLQLLDLLLQLLRL